MSVYCRKSSPHDIWHDSARELHHRSTADILPRLFGRNCAEISHGRRAPYRAKVPFHGHLAGNVRHILARNTTSAADLSTVSTGQQNSTCILKNPARRPAFLEGATSKPTDRRSCPSSGVKHSERRVGQNCRAQVAPLVLRDSLGFSRFRRDLSPPDPRAADRDGGRGRHADGYARRSHGGTNTMSS